MNNNIKLLLMLCCIGSVNSVTSEYSESEPQSEYDSERFADRGDSLGNDSTDVSGISEISSVTPGELYSMYTAMLTSRREKRLQLEAQLDFLQQKYDSEQERRLNLRHSIIVNKFLITDIPGDTLSELVEIEEFTIVLEGQQKRLERQRKELIDLNMSYEELHTKLTQVNTDILTIRRCLDELR